ncbi:unnamed protein product [Kuraishia capsulata CBS 1993]|uniref:DUF1746 domain-containing protein n=1 Tax=Kuraishia capsulata CBS 1993 TaxID=1382522 RepID=W6MXQ2_9ASCO|nr:uncharacterized protein KUCA_T00005273001 [Kuraishia capsulata CBS 1993]CDK29285.1 unnamed protein product [Kuraishia capsulata CBS 1993]
MSQPNEGAIQEVTDDIQLNDLRVRDLRRAEFQRNFAQTTELVTYSLILLLFLADESILRAGIRVFVQLVITNPFLQTNVRATDHTNDWKRIIAKKQLQMLMIVNCFCIAVHLMFPPGHVVTDTGMRLTDYTHGSTTLDIIGERKFQHWFFEYCYVLMLDIIIFSFQALMFCVECIHNQNITTEEEQAQIEGLQEIPPEGSKERADQEFDGYMGNVVLFSISPMKVLQIVARFSRGENTPEIDWTSVASSNA